MAQHLIILLNGYLSNINNCRIAAETPGNNYYTFRSLSITEPLSCASVNMNVLQQCNKDSTILISSHNYKVKTLPKKKSSPQLMINNDTQDNTDCKNPYVQQLEPSLRWDPAGSMITSFVICWVFYSSIRVWTLIPLYLGVPLHTNCLKWIGDIQVILTMPQLQRCFSYRCFSSTVVLHYQLF